MPLAAGSGRDRRRATAARRRGCGRSRRRPRVTPRAAPTAAAGTTSPSVPSLAGPTARRRRGGVGSGCRGDRCDWLGRCRRPAADRCGTRAARPGAVPSASGRGIRSAGRACRRAPPTSRGPSDRRTRLVLDPGERRLVFRHRAEDREPGRRRERARRRIAGHDREPLLVGQRVARQETEVDPRGGDARAVGQRRPPGATPPRSGCGRRPR